MGANKVAKYIFILLFLLFIALFISQNTGYYDYEVYKKTSLTKEQIQQFEEDVKAGKNVSVKDYISNTSKNYNNKLSNAGLSLSKKIEKYSKRVVESIFGALSNIVSN